MHSKNGSLSCREHATCRAADGMVGCQGPFRLEKRCGGEGVRGGYSRGACPCGRAVSARDARSARKRDGVGNLPATGQDHGSHDPSSEPTRSPELVIRRQRWNEGECAVERVRALAPMQSVDRWPWTGPSRENALLWCAVWVAEARAGWAACGCLPWGESRCRDNGRAHGYTILVCYT